MTEADIRGALMALGRHHQKDRHSSRPKIQDAGETWEKDHLAVTLPSNQVRELLDEVLGQLLPTTVDEKSDKTRRLVMFIDDLDRCEPETAFRLVGRHQDLPEHQSVACLCWASISAKFRACDCQGASSHRIKRNRTRAEVIDSGAGIHGESCAATSGICRYRIASCSGAQLSRHWTKDAS